MRDKVQLIRRYTGGGTVVIDSSTGKQKWEFMGPRVPVAARFSLLLLLQCVLQLVDLINHPFLCGHFNPYRYAVITVFSTFIMNDADVPSKPYPRDIMNWSDTDVYGPVFQTTQTDKSESNEVSSARGNHHNHHNHHIHHHHHCIDDNSTNALFRYAILLLSLLIIAYASCFAVFVTGK